jgi:hypothetical protein
MFENFNLVTQVFNERGVLLAFFGALGGMVRSAALKTTWKEGLRVAFIGSATAFGVGIVAPYVLKGYIGDLPEDLVGTIGILCGCAFLIGLAAVTYIERYLMSRGRSAAPSPAADAAAEEEGDGNAQI